MTAARRHLAAAWRTCGGGRGGRPGTITLRWLHGGAANRGKALIIGMAAAPLPGEGRRPKHSLHAPSEATFVDEAGWVPVAVIRLPPRSHYGRDLGDLHSDPFFAASPPPSCKVRRGEPQCRGRVAALEATPFLAGGIPRCEKTKWQERGEGRRMSGERRDVCTCAGRFKCASPTASSVRRRRRPPTGRATRLRAAPQSYLPHIRPSLP